MNDKIIINAISKIHFIIVSFFSFILLILFISFVTLLNGISIRDINLPNIQVKQLYIKWNQKLNISIDGINISTDKTKTKNINYKSINQIFQNAVLLDNWFEKISVRNFTMGDLKANLSYQDTKKGTFDFRSNNLEFNSTLLPQSDFLLLHIDQFHDTLHNIDLNGSIVFNKKTTEFISDIFVNIKNDAKFQLFSIANKKLFRYKLNFLNNIKDARDIFNIFNLDDNLKFWTVEAIKLDELHINDMYGWLAYKDLGNFYKHIFINANAVGLNYRYNVKLDSIRSKNTNLVLHNGVLYIYPNEAYTYDFYLDKSWLKIDFTKKHDLLTLYLLLKGQVNKDLLGILKAYKIHLPIYQKKGIVNADLSLAVTLYNGDVDVKGDFFAKKVNFDLFGTNLDASDLYVVLDNNDIHISNAFVRYKDIAKAYTSFQYNAKKNIGSVDLKFSSIQLKDANIALSQENKPLHATIDIAPNNTKLSFESSKWNLLDEEVYVDAIQAPIKINKNTINIPVTYLNSPNIATAYASGEVNYKNVTFGIDLDLLSFKKKDIKMTQSHALLHLNYDKNLQISSKEKIRFNIQKLDCMLNHALLEIDKDELNVKKSELYINDIASTSLNAKYNFKNKLGYTNINNFKIATKNFGEILSGKNNIAFNIQIKKDSIDISSKKLNIDFIATDKEWFASFNSLQQVTENSQLLRDYNISSGSLKIYRLKNKKFTNFILQAPLPYKILVKNEKPLNQYTVNGTIYDKSNNIDLKINKNTNITIDNQIKINTHNTGINLDAILSLIDKNQSQKKNKINKPIYFTSKESYLFLNKNRHIISDNMQLQYSNNILTAQLKHAKGSAGFKIEDGNLSLYGENFNDDFMSHFFALSKFKGGSLSFSMSGTTKEYDGVFFVKDTTIINYKILNNILAFVNTIPSLVTFRLPGYNTNGLYVKNAYMDFHSKNDVFKINNIFLDSKEMDILGKGTASIKNNNLDLELNLKTDLGSTLSKIPVVGYILFGEDSVSTTLSVKGKLSDPSVKSLLAKEMIVAPLNIIKRTLMLPYHLIADDKKK